MWPQKKGLGNRLSYGVDGNGLPLLNKNSLALKDGDSVHFDFPRHQDDGIQLHEISGSTLHLVQSQKPINDSNEEYETTENGSLLRNSRKIAVPGIYVPSDILTSCMVEANSIISSSVYDPSYGNLFTMFRTRTRSSHYQFEQTVAAYVTGETGNILNLSILKPQQIEVTHLQNEKKSDILLPDLLCPYQLSFTESIKQIEIGPVLPYFVSPLILVRTSGKIHVLKCFRSGTYVTSAWNSNLEVDVVAQILSADFKSFDFVDVAFNPYDFTLFTVIDIKGNFGIWKIPVRNTTDMMKLEAPVGSEKFILEDPSELSNWKRICWSYNPETMLIVTRSSITEIKLGKIWSSKKIVSSNTWSKIIDFVRTSESGFLLTSKELIWVNLKNCVERIMSWKHFLDDSDPTLRLSVSQLDEGIFKCLIYSQMHPLIFVYTFGFDDDRPYSLRDPYFIKRNTKLGNVQQITLAELNQGMYRSMKKVSEDDLVIGDENDLICRKFGLFELTTSLGLSMVSFSEIENLGINSLKTEYIRAGSKELEDELSSSTGANDAQIASKQLKLISSLLNNNSKSEFEQIEAIQNYAFSLGEGAFKLKNSEDVSILPAYFSLLDISENIPYNVSDIAEIDLMIEQLTRFFDQKQISLSSLINSAFLNRSKFKDRSHKDTQNKNIEDLHIALKTTFLSNQSLCEINEFSDLQKASVLIGSALIKAKSDTFTPIFVANYQKSFEEASSSVKELILEWDSADTETEQSQVETQYTNVISSIPSIKLGSQATSKSSGRRKKTFTQNSQLSVRGSLPTQAGSQYRSQNYSQDDFGSDSLTLNTQNTQHIPSSARLGSQKRFQSSQIGSQTKHKKKKKKGGFA
ncbi:uncharacterized protein CANTADRAFT_26852 [Suhomyces tanzawaensis NRRL Y-17324]|uniref:RRN6 beta-propeller domain-containing protein n=1 Tax=Suhomyces tanzawaensis NRRL Y-17324 TaxID=984487 RepID=A0A1E4SE89_9ASCO|nr:uncharacterized protein CANTADRAFT_26852 [Suhomyces tanzawaensis NRRL Y-17324]ODV77803.1 hypothetical protein CANTADRAFT_26852 [Suhomyces tanzawaensis NRRL Y-17324]